MSTPAERFLVCLPTYDERENLPRMVEALERVRARTPIEGDVLVIDDGSPDGTGQLADRLAEGREWLHVLHRTEKQGLGRAYVAGFEWALERGYGYILEMDADFSHDPDRLPALLEPVVEGRADVTLGSRYTQGGGVANWGIARRIISAGGCTYARTILGLSVRDLTGGYKCFRREVLEAIDLAGVGAQGYAFQIEMTYRVLLLGFRVEEVPIVFTDRVVGGSKMSRAIVAEAMWRVPQLRWRAARGGIPRAKPAA